MEISPHKIVQVKLKQKNWFKSYKKYKKNGSSWA